ncbi:YbaB/EbfC family nucleoid-associated protein [Actinosynnema sp. NPDC023658]|uniref:YbaB/EbfC family nucleoid-associated protein n=1 Tax=Actinosynnema sp. NPDC023658 TaxID=3155465 RepID=UPI0033DDAA79
MTQEQRLAAAEGLTEVLARTTGTAEHPTRLARATATATGELKALDLHPNALAQGPDAVGRLVVETARLATDAAVQTSYNELAKSLGDSMAMAVEAFAGPPPLKTAPPPGPPPVAPPPPAARTGWSAGPERPSGPTPPPWAGQRKSRPAPRPVPEETDDDDYFADPFRGQRQ